MEGEEWRDVVGYEGLYLVSCYGRIKRLPNHRVSDKRETHNNIRKLKERKKGYFYVNLSKENVIRWYSVHRIVGKAFLENPNNYPVINHKDENPQNNCASNLEWCTHLYNCLYGTGIERQKASRKRNDPNLESWKRAIETRDRNDNPNSSKRVCQSDLNGNIIAYFKSICEAARQTNGHVSDISRCCNGIAKQSKGYKWSFV